MFANLPNYGVVKRRTELPHNVWEWPMVPPHSGPWVLALAYAMRDVGCLRSVGAWSGSDLGLKSTKTGLCLRSTRGVFGLRLGMSLGLGLGLGLTPTTGGGLGLGSGSGPWAGGGRAVVSLESGSGPPVPLGVWCLGSPCMCAPHACAREQRAEGDSFAIGSRHPELWRIQSIPEALRHPTPPADLRSRHRLRDG